MCQNLSRAPLVRCQYRGTRNADVGGTRQRWLNHRAEWTTDAHVGGRIGREHGVGDKGSTVAPLLDVTCEELVALNDGLRLILELDRHRSQVQRHDLSPHDLVRPLGLEPRTNGLKVHCSTIELEAPALAKESPSEDRP